MITKAQKILLTGAAGYIGRATAIVLKREGFEPVGIDSFVASSRHGLSGFVCEEADLSDLRNARRAFKSVCAGGVPSALVHFAALALVGESSEQPEVYFRNNYLATLNVASLASEFGIPSFVHSSSCAVYGIPSQLPIDETMNLSPISPYGETKRSSEAILTHMAARHGLRGIHLRYFNPAGALEDLSWGEEHLPETHLIPRAVAAAISGEKLTVFGKSYPTHDGTCVRDFLHIEDLVYAHLAAIRTLARKPDLRVEVINVGAGRGASVLDVVRECESLSGRKIAIDWQPERPGDPPALVADIRKASAVMGWRPTRPLAEILKTQLAWSASRGQKS